MAQTKQKLATELVTIGRRLVAIGQELADGEVVRPPPPDNVAALVARRICLQCGTPEMVPLDKAYRRGLCAMHYQKTLNRIDRGKIVEADLISRGLITAEAQKGGRKTKAADPVAEMLNAAIKNTEQEIAAKGREMKAKRAAGQKPGQKRQ